MSKLSLIAAAGIGYVLGARAGRERYEQIVSTARQVSRNPRVQSAKRQATEVVTEQATMAKETAAATAKEAASAAASTLTDKRRGENATGGAHAAGRPDGPRRSPSEPGGSRACLPIPWPATRRLAGTWTALSSVVDAPHRLPPPPCQALRETTLATAEN